MNALARGCRLGSYEVIELLGVGGMGEVFRARDLRLGRDVAIKVLSEPFRLDAQRLLRFEREARALASLNHPNIAALYGMERLGDAHALVLELVEGQTLAERILVRGRLALSEALAIARQVAAALEAAHEQGVIHRDLKPSNIKLRPDGTVKLLDFGLAKVGEPSSQAADVAAITLTAVPADGKVMGTPAYMSPEQARGLPVDKRTDIWAFGCVLYEMIVGTPPFTGQSSTDVVARIIEREADLDALPREVPTAVRQLLRRCLCKDPRERLRDIGDARPELQEPAADATAGRAGWARRAAFAALALAGVAAVVATVPQLRDGTMAAARSVWARGHAMAGGSVTPVAARQSTSVPTIAVLPFVDMSPERDHEYFADGFTEQLTDQLSQLPGLRVIGRTSAFAFKGRNVDLRIIGQTLGAGHLLEGSVRRAGEQLRITAQLIDARGTHVWSRTYERERGDIFAIQDEVAAAVAAVLSVTLQSPDAAVSKGGTRNVEAQHAYLEGRALLISGLPDDIRKGIARLERAAELDPDFALAWSWLALVYQRSGTLPERGSADWSAKGQHASRRALELAPDLSVALMAGAVGSAQRGQWVEAEGLLNKAAATATPFDNPWLCFGCLYLNVGRPSAAVEYYKRAIVVDPLSSYPAMVLTHALEVSGDFQGAQAELLRAANLVGADPAFVKQRMMSLAMGRRDGPEVARRSLERTDPISRLLNPLLGQPDLARAKLREFAADPANRQAASQRLALATWLSYLREPELALSLLLEAPPDPTYTAVLWRPLMQEMRRLPGFKELVRRVGLVDYWRATGNWGDFCRPMGKDDFECR